MGLYLAPHPILLQGAVIIATFLGHRHLVKWMQCVPMTEAVLLVHYLNRDQMSAAD